jgi:hypothetical protein
MNGSEYLQTGEAQFSLSLGAIPPEKKISYISFIFLCSKPASPKVCLQHAVPPPPHCSTSMNSLSQTIK